MRSDLFSRMNLCEKDIEDWLYENPEAVSYISMIPAGSSKCKTITKWIGRQFEVPSGIIDLLGINDHGEIVVVEVKLGAIDGKAIAQCARYALDISIAANPDISHPCWAEYTEEITDLMYTPVERLVIGSSVELPVMLECRATETSFLAFAPAFTLSLFRPNTPYGFAEKYNNHLVSLATSDVIRSARSQYTSLWRHDGDSDTEPESSGEIIAQAETIAENAFATTTQESEC